MTAPAWDRLFSVAAADVQGIRRSTGPRATAPDQWAPWLRALFPRYVAHPFADRHEAFWEWVWAIDLESAPRPFIGVWPRGGGKSTSAELAVAALGIRGKRRYVLYVRDTQDRADDSVQNIASLLESSAIERYYPEHAERKVGKYGNSKGWRRNRLWTNGGFVVDAIGLDVAARGAKLEEQRPDLIVLDDIDGKHDSALVTAKKIAVITTSILPAGATNAGVLGIQNLIIPDGFFTRMTDGRADYLAQRIVSGPFPAVRGLKTEKRLDEESGTYVHVITAGKATWAGQDLKTCQRQIHEWGISAFRKEAQHEVTDKRDRLALRYVEATHPAGHLVDLTRSEVRALAELGQVFGGVDFGSWRFAFTLWAADTHGVPHCIGEVFSQREGAEQRAKEMHALWVEVGSPSGVRIWGDAANPQDIMELNLAFKRGWANDDALAYGTTEPRVVSPLRVVAVAMENKIRSASVERLNDLLDRQAIRFQRTLGAGQEWMLGMNAGSEGVEMEGSRLLWEMKHWGYPLPKDGQAQEQDPDDKGTADGADAIASMRYAIMSWWRPGKEKDVPERSAFDPAVLAEEADRSRRIAHRIGRKKGGRPMDHSFGDY